MYVCVCITRFHHRAATEHWHPRRSDRVDPADTGWDGDPGTKGLPGQDPPGLQSSGNATRLIL